MKSIIERRVAEFGKAANNGGIHHLKFEPDTTLLLLIERDARQAIASHKHWIEFYEKARHAALVERLARAREERS